MDYLDYIPTDELLDELFERVEGMGDNLWLIENLKALRNRTDDWLEGIAQRENDIIDFENGAIDFPPNYLGGFYDSTWREILKRNYWWKRLLENLDECQRARVSRYFPRAVDCRYVIVSETHLEWHNIDDRGGRVEFGGFVKLLFDFDGLHKIPFAIIRRLFWVNRVDRAVYSYLESPKYDDITDHLKDTIFGG